MLFAAHQAQAKAYDFEGWRQIGSKDFPVIVVDITLKYTAKSIACRAYDKYHNALGTGTKYLSNKMPGYYEVVFTIEQGKKANYVLCREQ